MYCKSEEICALKFINDLFLLTHSAKIIELFGIPEIKHEIRTPVLRIAPIVTQTQAY